MCAESPHQVCTWSKIFVVAPGPGPLIPRLGKIHRLPAFINARILRAEAVLRDNGPGSPAQPPDSGPWLSSIAMLFSQ